MPVMLPQQPGHYVSIPHYSQDADEWLTHKTRTHHQRPTPQYSYDDTQWRSRTVQADDQEQHTRQYSHDDDQQLLPNAHLRRQQPVRQYSQDADDWLLQKAKSHHQWQFTFVPSSNGHKMWIPISDDEEKVVEEEVWEPRREEWLIMATLAVSSLVVALDSTILVPVLPTLALELKGTSQQAFWAGTSYLLANAVFQPCIATVSDIFGRRALLVPSLLLFTIGSIICGVSENFGTLLPGRVIQGVGGGGIITMAQLVFADIIPLRQRPKYFSIVLLAWAMGTVLGPLIGGALAQNGAWRWCFYLNIPICVVALIMAMIFVKLNAPEASLKTKLRSIDWIGNTLFIASLTSLLIAISWGGIQYSWSSWHTLVPLIFGILGIFLTIIWEAFFASNPFLTRALFPNPSSVFSYLCAMLQGLSIFLTLYYFPFYAMAVLGKSALGAGVATLPASLCLLPGSAVASALITRLGSYRWAIWSGWMIATIGAGLFLLLDINTPTAVWAVSLCVFGAGMGMVLSSVNFSTQAVVAPADTGRAGSMYAFFRAIGMCLGVAVGGAVFQNFMRQQLAILHLPEALAAEAEGLVMFLKNYPSDSVDKLHLLEAYVHGFSGVWAVLTALCGTGLVLSLGIKHYSMDKILDSKFQLQR